MSYLSPGGSFRKMATRRRLKSQTGKTSQNIQVSCGLCKFLGKSAKAAKICKDCNGYLCVPCADSHRQAAVTKHHRLDDVDKVTSKMEPTPKCSIHGAALESFCVEHDVLCCTICVTSEHTGCRELVSISEAASGIRKNNGIKSGKGKLRVLSAKFKKAEKETEELIKSLRCKKTESIYQVQDFRKQINEALDQLEDYVLNKKDEICNKHLAKLNTNVKTCEAATDIIETCSLKIDKVMKGTENEIFISLKKAEAVQRKYNEIADSLISQCVKTRVDFIPNPDIMKYLHRLTSLGSIRVNDELVDTGMKEKGPTPLGEFSVNFPDDKNFPYIFGAAFLPSGKLVLADESNCNLKLFTSDLLPASTLTTGASPPHDIAAISATEFVATVPNLNSIHLIDINDDNEMSLKTIYALNDECKGITVLHGKIFVTCGKEIYSMNVDGQNKTVIKLSPAVMQGPQYLTASQERNLIYISDNQCGIIATETNGTVLHVSKDNSIKNYWGIDIDNKGRLFICTYSRHGLNILPAEETEQRRYITWTAHNIDTQMIPLAVACNPDKKVIVVSFDDEYRDTMKILKY